MPPAPDDDLPPLPAVPVGRYRHHSGKLYALEGVVRHSETLEPLALYRPLYGAGGLWVRPWAMFFETVVVGGVAQPRFRRLDDTAGDTADNAAGTPADTQPGTSSS